MAERTCNICFNESYQSRLTYVCYTCKDGFVCEDCVTYFDPFGTAFEGERYVKRTIKCPCCRQLNWKYHFSQIITVTLGGAVFDTDFFNHIPAVMIYINNSEY